MKKKSKKKLLGVNIDHVATLRQVRLSEYPDVKAAALAAIAGGATSITIHLREDRRHIQDADVTILKRAIRVPLNLEMALSPEITKIALRVKPEMVCIVPEKRKELTTEGGLDVTAKERDLKALVKKLRAKKIEVSLFIAPDSKQILAAHRVGADAIEIHTGTYANLKGAAQKRELARIRQAARLGCQLGLKVNAGHGLNLENVRDIVGILEMTELNIGHSIVARAIFVGMKQAVREMKRLI